MTLTQVQYKKYYKPRKTFMEREKVNRVLYWLFDRINFDKRVKFRKKTKTKFNGYFYNHFTRRYRNRSISRMRSICRITGRESAVSSFFRLSRQTFHTRIKTAKEFPSVNRYPFSKSNKLKYVNFKKTPTKRCF